MSDKLKKVIPWSIFILIMLILFMMIVFFVIVAIQPTFFPNSDISGIKNSFNTASSVVGFLSAGIGLYSLLQSSNNDKQVRKILEGINIIKEHQNALQVSQTIPNHKFAEARPDNLQEWKPDTVGNAE